MVRGCEVLRRVLPLRVGLEDIAVGADAALLVLLVSVVFGEERGRGTTPFFLFKAASSFGAWQLSAHVQRYPLLARPMQKQWWPYMSLE